MFGALVATPLCSSAVLGFKFDEAQEKRQAAPFPELTLAHLREFPNHFEAWFDDHFALRPALVRWSSLLRYHIAVSSSAQVIVGRHGWLFYKGDRALEQFRHTVSVSDTELSAWKDVLEQRRQWLAVRGIRYLVVFNPNKESVYSAEMPAAFTRLEGASVLERLERELAGTAVSFVDTTQSILAAHREDRAVFDQTDTHWNGVGRHAGYYAVASRLANWFPALRPIPLDDFDVERRTTRGGDLAIMLGIADEVVEQGRIFAEPKHKRAIDSPTGIAPTPASKHVAPMGFRIADATLPTAVVAGDSFMHGMAFFLAENFKRTVFAGHHDFDWTVIDRERPDVVIEGFIERQLLTVRPALRPELEIGPEPKLEFSVPPGTDEIHPPGRALPPLHTWRLHGLETRDGTDLVSSNAAWVEASVPPIDVTGAETFWIQITAFPVDENDTSQQWARLHWASTGAGFDEHSSVQFPIVVDGVAHRYRVRPSVSSGWKGKVTSLRLELPRDVPGLSYRLGTIDVVP